MDLRKTFTLHWVHGVILVVVVAIAGLVWLQPTASAAACSAPATNYGTASGSITIPEDGTYRLWSRIMAPNSTNNSYLLQIDAPSGTKCFKVGDKSITPNAWTWIDYRDGNSSAKLELVFKKGTYSVKFIGNEADVKLDRFIVTSDLACVPAASGNGDDCNKPSDSKPPTVNLTAPSENSTVSGKVDIKASATDNTGIQKVEFYVNSALQGTDTASPYSINWDSTQLANGQQLLLVRAYDTAGNVSSDSHKVTTRNGDTGAPTTPSNVKATASAYNKVLLTWNASTDNTGVASYRILRNGVPFTTVDAPGTQFEDVDVLPGTEYTYRVTAYDTAGNASGSSAAATVTTPKATDAEAPTTPSGLVATAAGATQINLKWNASTDNIGVATYAVYRQTGNGSAQKFVEVTGTAIGDASLKAGTKYTYYVVAVDGNGNTSKPSDKVSATTASTTTTGSKGIIKGVVKGGKDKQPTRYAHAQIVINGTRHTFTTNKDGEYVIPNLKSGSYNVTYSKTVHRSQTFTIKVSNNTVVHNVTLKYDLNQK